MAGTTSRSLRARPRTLAGTWPFRSFLGTFIVIALYFGASLAYVAVLPLEEIRHAPSDRVAGAVLQVIFPAVCAGLIAIVNIISAFGCMNALLTSGSELTSQNGARRRATVINQACVPGVSLVMQGVWAGFLLICTHNPTTGAFARKAARPYPYLGVSFGARSLYLERCCDPGGAVCVSSRDDFPGLVIVLRGPGLLRLQAFFGERFSSGRPGQALKVFIVVGIRPASCASPQSFPYLARPTIAWLG
jgi:hypothetical protein